MRLTTDRLRIAPLAAADVGAFTAYRADPAVARYQGWSVEWSEADSRRLVDEQDGWMLPPPGEWLQLGIHPVAAEDDATGPTLLGDVAVHRLADQPDTWELGVTLAPLSQRRGIAREALAAVIGALVHAHAAHRIIASSDARNDAVARLLTAVGLRHEGRALEADWFRGEWTTVDAWAVLAREWRERAAS